MQLLKIIVTFVSLGGIGAGTTYALFKLSKPPFWVTFGLVVATVMTAGAMLIFALLDLPKAVDSIDLAFDKAAEIFKRRLSPPVSSRPELPVTPSPTNEPQRSPPATSTIIPPSNSNENAGDRAIDAAVPRPAPIELKPLNPDDVKSQPQAPPSASQSSSPPGSLLPPSELQIETNTHLTVYEGAVYRLASGRTYFLEAPLGYTVGYRADEGSVTVFRDGKERIYCSIGFWTFARVSKYSVIACTETAVIRVAYVRMGKQFGSR
jgi:hypothetical protein